jgi:hypothetical protein
MTDKKPPPKEPRNPTNVLVFPGTKKAKRKPPETPAPSG